MHAQGSCRRNIPVNAGDIVFEFGRPSHTYAVVDTTADTVTLRNQRTGDELEFGAATFAARFEVAA